MKSSCIVFLCLLTAAFYFFSPTIITSSSSFIELPAGRMRPSVRKLSMLTPHDKHKYHKVKIGEDQMKGSSTVEEGSMALKHTRSQDNLDEQIYHIDYHGVTTHPTPTPKHPKP